MLVARTDGPVLIVTFPAMLDAERGQRLRGELLAALRRQGADLVLDLGDMTRIEPAGIELLLATGRRALLLGGSLRIAREPGGEVARALRAAGVERAIQVYPTVAAAVSEAALAASG